MNELNKLLKELPAYISPFNLILMKEIENTYYAGYINTVPEIVFSRYEGKGNTPLAALKELKKVLIKENLIK